MVRKRPLARIPTHTVWPTRGAAVLATIMMTLAAGSQASAAPIATVHHDGTVYDRYLPDGSENRAARERLAHEFYQAHGDHYDFLVVFTDFEFDFGGEGVAGFYVPVRNDVTGIGIPLFDAAASFASSGRLQGVIDMGSILDKGSEPGTAELRRTLFVLAHEMEHRFAVYPSYIDASGATSSALLGREGAHWSFFLDSDASLLYGADWRDNLDGTFTATAVEQRYSWLDLYLMGLASADEVEPWFLIAPDPGVTFAATDLPVAGVTISGTAETIAIAQVVSALGPRAPSTDEAQKEFRGAFVFLHQAPEPAPEHLAAIDRIRRAFVDELFFLTHGRAIMDTDLLEAPPATVAENPSTDLAIEYLLARQQPSGLWRDDARTIWTDTAASVSALQIFDGTEAAVATARLALEAVVASTPSLSGDVLSIANVARVLATTGIAPPEVLEALVAAQSQEGGFGIATGYVQDVRHTAAAAEAIAALAPEHVELVTLEAALRSLQNPDGGFSSIPGGTSRVLPTARALLALANVYGASAGEPEIGAAAQFLSSHRQPDGSFGDDVGDALTTAVAAQALLALDVGPANVASEAADYLFASQRPDGSWDELVAPTAEALLLLRRALSPNLAAVSVSASEDRPPEGTVVTLQVVVQNSGSTPSLATTASLVDGSGAEVDRVAVPALDAGETTSVSLAVDTEGRAGLQEMYVFVDPDDLVDESRETDNQRLIVLDVQPRPNEPDLRIVSSSVTVTPAAVTVLPTEVSIAARVENIGAQDVVLATVALVEDGITLASVPISVAGASAVDVSLELDITTGALRTLELVADPDEVIAEYDETNNSAPVVILPELTVDIYVSGLTVDPSDLEIGGDVGITATVSNRGTGAATPVVDFTIDFGSGPTRIATRLLDLAGGQTEQVVVTWHSNQVGDAIAVTAVADPLGVIDELDEANNTAGTTLRVAPSTRPNLAVSSEGILLEPDPPREGRAASITVTVTNNAVVDAPASEVRASLAAVNGPIVATGSAPVLVAGASAEVTLAWNVDAAGDVLLYVSVDPEDVLEEFDEDDNVAFLPLHVLSLPDLALDAGDLEFEPQMPREGEAVAVHVTVHNVGEQEAAGVQVALRVEGGALLGTLSLGTLPGSSNSTQTFSWPAPGATGEVVVVATADPSNTVGESDETNNVGTRSLRFQDADLYADNPVFSPNGDGVKDSVTVTYRTDLSGPLSVQIVDERGEVRGTLSGAPAAGSLTWDGRGAEGTVLEDDPYLLRLLSQAAELGGELTVEIDTDHSPVYRALERGDSYAVDLNSYDTVRSSATPSFMSGDDRVIYVSNPSSYVAEWQAFELDDRRRIPHPGLGISSNLLPSPWDDRVLEVTGGLSVYDASLGTSTPIATPGVSFSASYYDQLPIWAPGGGAVYARLRRGLALARVELSSGEVTLVAPGVGEFASATVRQYDVSRDGRRIVWSFPNDDATDELIFTDESGSFQQALGIQVPRVELLYSDRLVLRKFNLEPDGERLAYFAPFNVDESRSCCIGQSEPGCEDPVVEECVCNVRGDCCSSRWDEQGWSYSCTAIAMTQCGLSCTPTGGYATCEGGVRVLELDSGVVETVDEFSWPARIVAGSDCEVYENPECPPVPACVVDDQLDIQWSPDGKRILYASGSNRVAGSERIVLVDPDGGQRQEITHTLPFIVDLQSGQFAAETADMLDVEWSPGQKYALLRSAKVLGSWDNLTARLQIFRAPQAEALSILASADDLHFDSYSIDAFSQAAPETRIPVMPARRLAVRDQLVATWAPPSPGSYRIVLTARDTAGNVVQQERLAAFSTAPLVSSLTAEPGFISPNGDGTRDETMIAYTLSDAANLLISVSDESGNVVRTLAQTHAEAGEYSVGWDGTGDDGVLQPDGAYVVAVDGQMSSVILDNTPPAVEVEIDGPKLVPDRYNPARRLRYLVQWSADDAFLDKGATALQYRPAFSGVEFETRSTRPPAQLELRTVSGHDWQVVASDLAGNRTVVQVPRPEHLAVWQASGNAARLVENLSPDRYYDGTIDPALVFGTPLAQTPVVPLFPKTALLVIDDSVTLPIEHVEVEARPVAGGDPIVTDAETFDPATGVITWVPTGLANQAVYYIRVRALNVAGTGFVSNEFRARYQQTVTRLSSPGCTGAIQWRQIVGGTEPGIEPLSGMQVRASEYLRLDGAILGFDEPIERAGGATMRVRGRDTGKEVELPAAFFDCRPGLSPPDDTTTDSLCTALREADSGANAVIAWNAEDAPECQVRLQAELTATTGQVYVAALDSSVREFADICQLRVARVDGDLVVVESFPPGGLPVGASVHARDGFGSSTYPLVPFEGKSSQLGSLPSLPSCGQTEVFAVLPGVDQRAQSTALCPVPGFGVPCFDAARGGVAIQTDTTYVHPECGATPEVELEKRLLLTSYSDVAVDYEVSWTFTGPAGESTTFGPFYGSGSSLVDTQRFLSSELSEGDWQILVQGTDEFGGELTFESGFVVDKTPPVVDLRRPAEGARVCPEYRPYSGRPRPYVSIEGLVADEHLPTDVFLHLRMLGGTIANSWAVPHANYDGVIMELPVPNMPSGEYFLSLQAWDIGHSRRCDSVVFDLDMSVEAGLTRPSPAIISPNADGVLDSTSVFALLEEGVTLSASVASASGTRVRTLAADVPVADTSFEVPWLGLDDLGAQVADGMYSITVDLEDECGNPWSETRPVEVDTTPPTVAILTPMPDSTLSGPVEITADANDPHFQSYRLTFAPASDPTAATVVALGGHELEVDVVAVWDSGAVSPGDYVVRLEATDTAGNSESSEVVLHVQPTVLIAGLSAAPRVFSPNGDGLADSTEIELRLTAAAHVTLVVADESGTPLGSIAELDLPDGASTVSWDGGGLADAAYRVLATAETGTLTDSGEITVELDTQPPIVQVDEPVEDGFLSQPGEVLGTIDDQHLASAQISVGPDAANLETVAELRGARSGALAVLQGLAEATYLLRIDAVDLAENRTTIDRLFSVDTTAPAVQILEPEPLAFLGTANMETPVTAEVVELNPGTWTLEHGAGADPAAFTEIASGSGAPPDPTVALWSLAGSPDGERTLRLTVTDLAGNAAHDAVVVTVDQTAPTVALTNPTNGAFILGERSLVGTATDANFASYGVTLSSGGSTPAELFRKTAPVTARYLGRLAPLPPDGAYTLGLIAEDLAGNTAHTDVTVTVDTTPPAAPEPVDAILAGLDVEVSWRPSASEDVDGYHVDRTQVGGATIGLVDLPSSETTLVDADVPDGTYTYSVLAFDVAGLASSPAESAPVTIDRTPPIAQILSPEDGGSVAGVTEVVATAAAARDDLREWRLLVALDGTEASLTRVRSAGTQVTSEVLHAIDTTALAGGQTILLRLEAEDLTGNIAADDALVTIDNEAPDAVTLLSATATANTVSLTWSASSAPDLAGYAFLRDGDFFGVSGLDEIGHLLISGTSYADTGLGDGQYSYEVVVVDLAGNRSPPSNSLSAVIESGAPRALIVQPDRDALLYERTEVVARVLDGDRDVSQVEFQIASSPGGTFVPIDTPVQVPPWAVELDPAALAPGSYELRAVAQDAGGNADPSPFTVPVRIDRIQQPPTDLQAHVEGGFITLTWTSPTPAPQGGFTVDRDGQTVADAIAEVQYVDGPLPEATYSYTVAALSLFGLQDVAGPASARIYRPALTGREAGPGAVEVLGSNVEPGAQVVLAEGGALVAETTADDSGNFGAVLTLAPGKHWFTAVATDSRGNASLRGHLRLSVPQGEIGLALTGVTGGDVSLAWTLDPAGLPCPESDCGDAIDNDGDGRVDCDDSDCAADPACTTGGAGAVCCDVNDTPGCDDPQVEVCVCGVDEYCCAVEWDPLCVEQAVDLCSASCQPGDLENAQCILQLVRTDSREATTARALGGIAPGSTTDRVAGSGAFTYLVELQIGDGDQIARSNTVTVAVDIPPRLTSPTYAGGRMRSYSSTLPVAGLSAPGNTVAVSQDGIPLGNATASTATVSNTLPVHGLVNFPTQLKLLSSGEVVVVLHQDPDTYRTQLRAIRCDDGAILFDAIEAYSFVLARGRERIAFLQRSPWRLQVVDPLDGAVNNITSSAFSGVERLVGFVDDGSEVLLSTRDQTGAWSVIALDVESGAQRVIVPTGEELNVSNVRAAGDGRRIAYRRDLATLEVVVRDVASGAVLGGYPFEGNVVLDEEPFSPDERFVQVLTMDPDSGAWMVTVIDNDTSQVVDSRQTYSFGAIARWSPDSRFLSFLGADQSLQLLDVLAGDLRRLTDDANVAGTSLLFRPDGEAVLYDQDGQLMVHDLDAMSGRPLEVDGEPIRGRALDWGTTAHLVVEIGNTATSVAIVEPAGRFELPATMHPGENVFVARDVLPDDSLGSASLPAIAEYIDTRPDLSIDRVVISPEAPAAGEIATVTAELGMDAGFYQPVVVSFAAVDPSAHGVLLEQEVDVSDPTARFFWPVGDSPGDHRIMLAVDPQDAIAEANEQNNTYEATILVGQAGELLVDVAVDRAAYLPGDEIAITGIVASTGVQRTGLLQIALEDAARTLVQPVQSLPVALAAGEVADIVAMVVAPPVLPGGYAVHATFTDETSLELVAEDTASFEILQLRAASVRLVMDRFTYDPVGTAILDVSVTNESPNGALQDVTVRTTVSDAGGQLVQVWDRALGMLPLAATRAVVEELPLDGMAAGSYAVLAEVWANGARLALAESEFEVRAMTFVAGGLTASPSAVVSPAPVSLTGNLVATGNVSPIGVAGRLRVTAGGAPVDQVDLGLFTLDVGVPQAFAHTVDTSGLAVGTYAAELLATPAGESERRVATAGFRIKEGNAPQLSFANLEEGGFYQRSVALLVQAIDDSSGVEIVELSVDGGPAAPLARVSGGTLIGEYGTTLILTDGPHTLVAQAVDVEGNGPAIAPDDANPVSVSVVIDGTPPEVTVSGVEEGATYLDFVFATVTFSDDNLAATRLELDDEPYTSGAQIGHGEHTLLASATDRAGNTSQTILRFTVILDTDPPAIVVTGVDDGAYYNTAVTPTISITDESDFSSAVTLDGAPYVSGTPVAAEGSHVLRVEAEDVFGNVADPVEISWVIDGTPPEIAITGVEDGAYTNHGVTPVIAVAEANPYQQSIQLNGAPFVSGTVVSAEGDYTLDVTATDLAGNSASASVSWVIDQTPPVITVSGVDDGAYTNHDVTPVVSVTEPHLDQQSIQLNGAPFVSGTIVSAEGDYVLEVTATDLAGNSASVTVSWTIDKTAPVIVVSGVEDGAYYSHDVTPVISVTEPRPDQQSIQLNGAPFVSGTVVSAEGDYALEVTATDLAGNNASATISWSIDETAPAIVITGVDDGAYYSHDVAPVVAVTELHPDHETIELNGAAFASGTVVSAEGDYTLEVTATDLAGNSASASVSWVIDLTFPVVTFSGVEDGAYTSHDVTPVISVTEPHPDQQSIQLDGAPFVSGTVVSAEGDHTLEVTATDLAGNSASATVSWTIDKTAPVIVVSGVDDGAYCNHDVTPVITVTEIHPDQETIELNGAPFVSGTVVGAEDDYTLEVTATDLAGNSASASVSWVIDLSPPVIVILGVSDGGRYYGSVTPVIMVDEGYLATATATLNGEPFVSGTEIVAAGDYELLVTAQDLAGNQATASVRFEIRVAMAPFGFAVCAFEDAELANRALVASFDGLSGDTGAEGHIATHGDLTLEDRASVLGSAVVGGKLEAGRHASIDGDVYVGCPPDDDGGCGHSHGAHCSCSGGPGYGFNHPCRLGGDHDLDDEACEAVISGDIIPVCPAPQPCECGYDIDSALTLAASFNDNELLLADPMLAASLVRGGLNVRGRVSLVLPSGDYYLQYLWVHRHAEILVEDGALVRLFVEGSVKVSETASLQAALDTGAMLEIISRANVACWERVELANHTESVTYIYAPRAKVKISNHAALYGGIVGSTVSVENRGRVYMLGSAIGPPSLVCAGEGYPGLVGGIPRECPQHGGCGGFWWVGDWPGEWPGDWPGEWGCDWPGGCDGDWPGEWPGDWPGEWPGDWPGEWPGDWPGEWGCDWPGGCDGDWSGDWPGVWGGSSWGSGNTSADEEVSP